MVDVIVDCYGWGCHF